MTLSADKTAAPRATSPSSRSRRIRAAALVPLSVVVVLAGTEWSTDHPAGADKLGDARAQAASIAAQIQATDERLQVLTDQYSAADYHLAQLNGQITETQRQIGVDKTAVVQNQKALRKQAISDYTGSGTSSQATDLFTSDRNVAGVRDEYSRIAAGNVSTIIANLHSSVAQLSGEQANLQHQQLQASNARSVLATAKNQASTLVAQEQATRAGVDAQIQTLVAQQQAAASAAAAAAFTAKVNAAQASAKAAASTTTTSNTSGSTNPTRGSSPTAVPTTVPTAPAPPSAPPPPLASGAAGAIQAAEQEVGVPYVWGGASPSTGFDCSGLIMWAYAQVGIGLPHYSGAQFSSTVHIPLADIQPGDLLFYGSQGSDHEAMYVGGGQMIEAPHAGASVRIVGVRTDSSTVVGRVQ